MFVELLNVCRDCRVRDLQNFRKAAVIHLDLKHPCVRIAFRKFENVLKVRAAPRVDRLRIIADDHHIPVIPSEKIDQISLDLVRVLIFIHENELKLPPVKFSNALVALKHRQRLFQQVIEIHGVGRFFLFFIAIMDVFDFFEQWQEIGKLFRKQLF